MQHQLPFDRTGNDNAPTDPVRHEAGIAPHRKDSRHQIP
jgi:hypothetical protein